MPASTDSRALRALSKMELYSSTRHHLGIYRCVGLTCRYAPSPSPRAVFTALGAVITKHPMLRVGILGEDTDHAHFSHVKEIDLQSHVEFRTLEGKEYDVALSNVQAWCHDQLFQDVEARPPWRIIVTKPEAEADFQDIVFTFHHSLMDGTSGKNFHEELLAALNQVQDSTSKPAHLLSFPDPPTLPEGQEDVIPYTLTWSFVAKTLWKHLGPSMLQPANPPVWHGEPIDFSRPHDARVLAVDIPAEDFFALLIQCRAHETTITALIHALILTSLARQLPASEAPEFASTTPINLRPWLSPSTDPDLKDTFRVLVTNTSHSFSQSTTSSIRSASDADVNALIWQIAQRVKSDIRNRASTLPADDPVSLLKHVSSWDDFWRKRDGQPREASWEVSSIGTISPSSSNKGGQGGYQITRMLFTNGVMVAGNPMSFGLGTVTSGIMTVGISWQEGVVEGGLIDGVMRDLMTYAKSLRETGRFVSRN